MAAVAPLLNLTNSGSDAINKVAVAHLCKYFGSCVTEWVIPVSSEISDFTPCTHTQSNILHTKYADKTDY